MSTAAEKIKNFFKKKKSEAKFKVSQSVFFFLVFSIYLYFVFFIQKFQLAGPGRRLDSTDDAAAGSSKSIKSQSDVYVPPKRTELTSEARLLFTICILAFQQQHHKENQIVLQFFFSRNFSELQLRPRSHEFNRIKKMIHTLIRHWQRFELRCNVNWRQNVRQKLI